MTRESRALAALIAGRPVNGGPKPPALTAVVEVVTIASPLTCQPLDGGAPAAVAGQVTAAVGDLVLILELGAGLRVAVVKL